MDSRRVIAAQIRARERAERLGHLKAQESGGNAHEGAQKSDNIRGVFLPLLTILMIVFTGGYWHFFGSPFEISMPLSGLLRAESSLVTKNDRHVNEHFKLSGVQLGMTPGMVRRLHPQAKITSDRRGETVMTLSTTRGMVVAWFNEHGPVAEVDGQSVGDERQRIYRLRRDEAYATFTEQDLMNSYGRRYGRPIEAKCERSQLGDSPRCTYRWWGGNGIELTAILKQKIDTNGQPYVLLTTIATNMQKSARQAAKPLIRSHG